MDETPLYPRILGAAFATLPPALQQLHGTGAPRQWRGRADVRHGRGLIARLVRAVVGFPHAGHDIPVTVTFKPDASGELWTRTFAGRDFSSYQSAGTGRDSGWLTERFGKATFALALEIEQGRLLLIPRRWSLFGIPMPRFLLPRGISYEHEEAGRFCFNVEISAPFAGLIVAYQGSLNPL